MLRKSITLNEVAEAAGVSTMTASRAINHQPGVSNRTRDVILKLAADMGYTANRSAQKQTSGRNRVIGVLAAELDNPFIGALVSGAVRAAAVAGHEVLIYSLVDHAGRPAGSVMNLLQQFTDGVIAVLPYQFDFVEQLSKAKHPVITIDNHSDHSTFPSISADSYGGARKAIEYLAELGHKRIAFVTGDEHLGSARDRHRAYDDSVKLLDLDNDPRLVLKGDYSLRSGQEAGHKILKLEHKPTAVFASNDMSAVGLMSVLQAGNMRIPEDISVVGFDDLPIASQIHPSLTTVKQPIAEMGRSAVNALLTLIAGIDVAASKFVLPTSFVIRDSVAPLK
ncbi:MAG: hypothetical protein RI918_1758 [Pseudomonadota bacterium]|jgi:LacI family transcriptional regulator